MSNAVHWLTVAAVLLLSGCGADQMKCARELATETWKAAPACAECAERIAETVATARRCHTTKKTAPAAGD